MLQTPSIFPSDARMFFCIGAQKAGTTWLYDLLRTSAECHFAPLKELHYFDVITSKGKQALRLRLDMAAALVTALATQDGTIDPHALRRLQDVAAHLAIYAAPNAGPDRHRAYLAYLLAGRDRQQVICDITPAYATLDRDTFAQMAAIGEARFLFILRDPVNRMWSQIRMAVVACNPAPDDYGHACLARARHLIASGQLEHVARADYRRTVTALDAAAAPDRVSYVFYEHLFAQHTIDGICAFLDIAPLAAKAAHRVNEGRAAPILPEIAAAFRRAFAPQYDFARQRFGAAVPDAWTTT